MGQRFKHRASGTLQRAIKGPNDYTICDKGGTCTSMACDHEVGCCGGIHAKGSIFADHVAGMVSIKHIVAVPVIRHVATTWQLSSSSLQL